MNDAYAVEYSDRAEKAFKRLDKTIASRIRSALKKLSEDTDERQHEALTGQWKGYFSLHVGSYSVIYLLDREIRLIFVEKLGHRRNVYDE